MIHGGCRGSEEERPRRVEVKPTLTAKPTCGEAGNVQQRVTAHAHHFRSIPRQEGPRCLSNLRWMCHAAQAHRAPSALVFEHPAHAKQAHRKRCGQLYLYRVVTAERRESVSQIQRCKVNHWRQQRNLGGQEAPAVKLPSPGSLLRIRAILAQRDCGNCRKREQCQQRCKAIERPSSRPRRFDQHAH